MHDDTMPARVRQRKINGVYFVEVEHKPWGWACCDRACFSAEAAQRYAAKLEARIEAARAADTARRLRIKELRRAARKAGQ